MQGSTSLSYEEAIERARIAQSFVDHPYWAILSRMLTGTIQSETEEMLASDARLSVNRASVAICRKVLQAPFFDIEQGRAVVSMYESAQQKHAQSTSRNTEKEQIPWLRQVQ